MVLSTNVLLFLSILTLCNHLVRVSASPESLFFASGVSEGDKELNGEASPEICLINRTPQRCFFVHQDGAISSSNISLTRDNILTQETVFGVFWNPHTKINNSGKVFYRLTTNESILSKADRYIHRDYPNEQEFHAEEVLVATWQHIESENSTFSTFQCVLAVGEADLYVMYHYIDVFARTDGDLSQQVEDSWVGYVVSDLDIAFNQSFYWAERRPPYDRNASNINVNVPWQWIHQIQGFSRKHFQLLFPHGNGIDPNFLPFDDDHSYRNVCSDIGYTMYDKKYPCWTININGLLSSDYKYTTHVITEFEKIREKQAYLAVLWSDWITSVPIGKPDANASDAVKRAYREFPNKYVYYRKTTDSSQLAEANRRINQAYKSDNFSAKELTIITWDDVGHYYDYYVLHNLLSKFQCVLAVDGKRMYALYLYDYLLEPTAKGEKTSSRALTGYTTADGRFNHTLDVYTTKDIIKLPNASNVGVPGQWIFPLFERDSSVEQDEKNNISYIKTKASVEITTESSKQTIGEQENIGAILKIEEGAVSTEKNLTLNLTLRGCVSQIDVKIPVKDKFIKNDNVKLDPKEPEQIVVKEEEDSDTVSYVYTPATSFYAIEKNNVDFVGEFAMAITHSIDMEEYKNFSNEFVFHLHKETPTGIEYIATKLGNFSETAEGVPYGQLLISSYYFKFSLTIFVRLVYREPIEPTSPMTKTVTSTETVTVTAAASDTSSTTNSKLSQSSHIKYKYTVRFYKSLPYSPSFFTVFVLAKRHDSNIIKIIQEKIRDKYLLSHGIDPDNSLCCEEQTRKFADGSDSVNVTIDKKDLIGYAIEHVSPLKITYDDVEDSFSGDIDFPKRINFKFTRLNVPGQVGGNTRFITSGFSEPLIFPFSIRPSNDACSSRPCQNGICLAQENGTYLCHCDSSYRGKNCEIRDACFSSPCLNRGKCINEQDGDYFCSCPPNYSGQNCENNACFSKPCKNGGTCSIKQDGAYLCSCNTYKYYGRDCENEKHTFEQFCYTCFDCWREIALTIFALIVLYYLLEYTSLKRWCRYAFHLVTSNKNAAPSKPVTTLSHLGDVHEEPIIYYKHVVEPPSPTVTLEDLVKDYDVSTVNLDVRVPESVLKKIAAEVTLWKGLGRELGVHPQTLGEIDAEKLFSHFNKALSVLENWRANFQDATLRRLLQIFLKYRRTELARKTFKILETMVKEDKVPSCLKLSSSN